jgi:Protein of unknown function (DUF3224)
MKVNGTYKVKKWEENQYEQISAEMKITKASVEYLINGEIEGNAFLEYLMFYKYFDSNDQHKSSAVYIGLMKFEGKLQGKQGSFIVEDRGAFEDGIASSILEIISGSGLGELKGIEGKGQYCASKDGANIEFEYIL